jgi:hypothetical protein
MCLRKVLESRASCGRRNCQSNTPVDSEIGDAKVIEVDVEDPVFDSEEVSSQQVPPVPARTLLQQVLERAPDWDTSQFTLEDVTFWQREDGTDWLLSSSLNSKVFPRRLCQSLGV